MLKLYSYWESTAAWRVRFALHLKNIEFEYVPVDLSAHRQFDREYLRLNPIGEVPALMLEDGSVLTQSLPIIEFLDRIWPSPRLIPEDPFRRARVMAAANIVACDTHPIQNLRVREYLSGPEMGLGAAKATAFQRHWIELGLNAYEALIDEAGGFSFGDEITIADLCVIPQFYNAFRYEADVSGLSRIAGIDSIARELPAYERAHPYRQPDAPERKAADPARD